MPALDDILARDAQVDDERLRQADHDNQWAQTFASTPPTEVLRASRNVTDLVHSAIENKARLLAQTDVNAAKIYATNAKLAEWQEQAPLRDQLLRAKIAAEGAATRFKEHQEALTAEHTAGFMDHMVNAPDESSPDYDNYVLGGLKKYHKVATTSIGKEFLENIAKGREVAKSLTDIQGEHPDLQLRQAKLNKAGLPIETTLVAPKGEEEKEVPATVAKEYADLVAEPDLVKRNAKIEVFHRLYPQLVPPKPEAPAPVAKTESAPEVKRRKFNKETGKPE